MTLHTLLHTSQVSKELILQTRLSFQAPKRKEIIRVYHLVRLRVASLHNFLEAFSTSIGRDSDDVEQASRHTVSDCTQLSQRQYDVTRSLSDMQSAIERYNIKNEFTIWTQCHELAEFSLLK